MATTTASGSGGKRCAYYPFIGPSQKVIKDALVPPLLKRKAPFPRPDECKQRARRDYRFRVTCDERLTTYTHQFFFFTVMTRRATKRLKSRQLSRGFSSDSRARVASRRSLAIIPVLESRMQISRAFYSAETIFGHSPRENSVFDFALARPSASRRRLPKSDSSAHCSLSRSSVSKTDGQRRACARGVPDFTLCKKVSAARRIRTMMSHFLP